MKRSRIISEEDQKMLSPKPEPRPVAAQLEVTDLKTLYNRIEKKEFHFLKDSD